MEKYLYAKAEEFICETVHLLNQVFFLRKSSMHTSEKHVVEQKIEAAGYIYRQNIGTHISIEDICRKVGVNRNVLSSALKIYLDNLPPNTHALKHWNGQEDRLLMVIPA